MSRHRELTKREREVLQAVADGLRSAEIATRAGITQNTVKCYLKSVRAKLETRSAANSVAKAIRQGVIA